MIMSDLHRYMWLKVSDVNAGAAETQESTKGPSPPQIAPKQSDSTSSTPNPIKAPFSLGTPFSISSYCFASSCPSGASLAAAATTSYMMSASCSLLCGSTVGKDRVNRLRVISELFLTPFPGWLSHKGNPITGWALCMLCHVVCFSCCSFVELTWSVVNADPAAPVSQSAQETQAVDKTATPPPHETPAIQGLQEGQHACCSQCCARILHF